MSISLDFFNEISVYIKLNSIGDFMKVVGFLEFLEDENESNF